MNTAIIRKALLSTLAATAVMTATPALAQNVTFSIGVGSPGYSQGYGYGYDRGHGNDRGFGHDRSYGYDRGFGHDRGYGYDRGYGGDLQIRAERLAQRINRVAHNGRVSRGEAQRLSWEMQHYRSLEWRYGRDGLSRREYAALSNRLDRIEVMLRQERRDRW